MNYEVIMKQLVRLKAELGEKEMTEQIIQRLLPTAICMTSSKEIGTELILKLIVVEGIYATLSLALPGREKDLIEKLNNLFPLITADRTLFVNICIQWVTQQVEQRNIGIYFIKIMSLKGDLFGIGWTKEYVNLFLYHLVKILELDQ